MALVPCPECQKEVSTQALACPQCAFPYPGKHGQLESSQSQNLKACPDCGFLVSKHATSCPHCGMTKLYDQADQTTNGNLSEQTWLCPHCGTPYTRKVKLSETTIPNSPEVSAMVALEKREDPPVLETEAEVPPPPLEPLLPLRSRPPLWGNSLAKDDVPSPRHSHSSRNKTFIIGLLIFVVVALVIGFGILWQVQGINPFEALVSLRM